MEIERKFLIDGFPHLPANHSAIIQQGYLCCSPVVRIRSKQCGGQTSYRLCFKGKGTLVREEIELDIEKNVFLSLCSLLEGPLILKEWKTFPLADGLVLECSHVDAGTPTSFYYAEVEFSSIEQANAFIPPSYLGKEVTEDPSYSMSQYWLHTRQRHIE